MLPGVRRQPRTASRRDDEAPLVAAVPTPASQAGTAAGRTGTREAEDAVSRSRGRHPVVPAPPCLFPL